MGLYGHYSREKETLVNIKNSVLVIVFPVSTFEIRSSPFESVLIVNVN